MNVFKKNKTQKNKTQQITNVITIAVSDCLDF